MRTTTASLAAFVLLTALNAGAAMAAVSAADKTFATEAAQGGLAEVEMGQLALQKATSPQVKQFAQQMVSDHTKANQELMQLAKSQGMDLPSQVDAKHKSAMERLQGMNGSAFDTAYMQDMVQDHQQDIADFQKQPQGSGDPALKSFAQKYLPTLQQHLQMAQSVASRPEGRQVNPRMQENDELEQPGLDNRHRDKNGQIARKHGNTLISALRQTYGASFAKDHPDDAKLVDVLHQLDEPSPSHQLDEPSPSTLVHEVHGKT